MDLLALKDKWASLAVSSSAPWQDKNFGHLPGGRGNYPAVVIIMIVGADEPERVREVLETLLANTRYPGWRIQLVDNACRPEVSEMLGIVPRASVLRNERRVSAPANRNKAFRATTADYFVCMDSDVLVRDPFWLHKLAAVAESDQRIGIVGGGLNSCGSFWWVNRDGVARPSHFYFQKYVRQKPYECQVIQSHCALVRSETLKQIGLFDEGFCPIYGEETDLCLRAVANNWRVFDTFLNVFHLGSRDTKSGLGRERALALDMAGNRRVALRWGGLLPNRPYSAYDSALTYLDHFRKNAPAALPLMPALPPLTDENGEINARFAVKTPTPGREHAGRKMINLVKSAIKYFLLSACLRVRHEWR